MPSSSPVTSPATVRSDVRVRAESLKSRATPKGESPIHRKESPRSLAGPSKPLNNGTPAASARPKSLMGSSVRPRPVSYPARPNSPLPPPRPASPLPPPRPRSPLPPLDRTKPTLSRSQTAPKVAPPPRSPERERGHSRVPSSPSPSPGKRSVHRASMSHIPVRTPVKPQIKLANGRAENAVQSSDTTSSQHIPQILEPEDSDVSEPAQDIDVFTETDEGRRSPSPPRAPVERRRSPSPPFSQPVTSDEEVFQKALTIAPPASPPPSPPTPKPAVMAPLEPEPAPATTTTIFGVLSTPTKRPSFSSSRSSLEFRTPSPPHGLPELPDPPSSSDEDTEKEQPATTPLRFNGASDTLTKTPRPPGAWANTPAPVRTNSLPPLEQEDSDSQYESGLATPGPSLSRASTLPVQTPRPPGGWMNTPTPRKSILKVRFDPQHTELELSATEDQSSSNGNLDESCQVSETSIADVPEEQAPPPEVPSTPVSPSRSPTRSPRRSPTIRVVDAFGRPESKSTKNPKNRNRNPVRIVDAMGREVEAVETSVKVEVLDIDVPLSHNEALRAVREGVNDLARTLDELDISSDFVQGDESHLRDLDNASRTARATREELKQTYQTDRIEQLRASMRQSQSTSRPEARPSTQWIWYWTAIIFCQALFIFLLYRNMRNTTKNMFLTTYYDPFYPDLHLYGIKYDYLTFPRTSPTISSLFNTLRQDGFQAFWAHLGDVFALLFADWRVDTWNRWGGDDMPQSVRWPPT
ncbi:hypothetical protein R3P38DRAFT_2497343 [Favolaschia claudopus]|uniref:Uncharacterized protein n=1 Tax=Favolaschia claudopus TaxID=2862362 RepID=A0AAW0E125_9AGAR